MTSKELIAHAVPKSGIVTPKQMGFGGGLEAASRTDRETALWRPSMRSPDQVINAAKTLTDARTRDMTYNDGYVRGGVQTQKDTIVGGRYMLTAKPNWRVIFGQGRRSNNYAQGWAEEFQQVVEERFRLVAESRNFWLDASGKQTFTGMLRLAIGTFVMTGEVLSVAEWDRTRGRPFKTAVRLIAPARLSNPNDMSDTRYLRRGIQHNRKMKPVFYNIRKARPTEHYEDSDAWTWEKVSSYVPGGRGRKQVVHIVEPWEIDQSRGIADMVAALKTMRMSKNFRDVTLQNAVINASYAAAIESELSPDMVRAMMGDSVTAGPDAFGNAIGSFLNALGGYVEGAGNLKVDGAKIPHLFPNTKLNMKPMGTPGGVGDTFEDSLLRHAAAALGQSFEEFAHNFSKVSYSGGKLSLATTGRYVAARKKVVADACADEWYGLWLEEEINNGEVPLPRGFTVEDFYRPLMREAFSQATWIGAGMGQIDELKETQAAILRIKSGLSTYEIEAARLGYDFRDVLEQREREEAIIADRGLTISLETTKSGSQNDQKPASAGAAAADDAAEEDTGDE